MQAAEEATKYIRLQKFLADCGIASRRAAEKLILKSKVKVNGKVVTTLGIKVNPRCDLIEYNGKLITYSQEFVYIALNKPSGYVTSCKQKRAKTVLDLIKTNKRLFPVGRLDKDSEGLIIITNDGELAYQLTHPSFEHEKEYLVEVKESISSRQISQLKKGINLDGRKTYPTKIKRLGARRFLITLHEGRNRQIRRMCEKVRLNVTKLKRIRVGNLSLENLKAGEWKYVPKPGL